MADLTAQPGELHFTIEVKRAATGEVETHHLVGKIVEEPDDEESEEPE
ncbi:hypothetical protein L7H23_01210 [Sphingopyxis sp. BSN-002]|nr:hypothetical protein [Sphingopyxis sp. BSN-002]UKK84752.1 hypothetical protein L7H23_01210 [Sphingopyxis sp. BSN-002]